MIAPSYHPPRPRTMSQRAGRSLFASRASGLAADPTQAIAVANTPVPVPATATPRAHAPAPASQPPPKLQLKPYPPGVHAPARAPVAELQYPIRRAPTGQISHPQDCGAGGAQLLRRPATRPDPGRTADALRPYQHLRQDPPRRAPGAQGLRDRPRPRLHGHHAAGGGAHAGPSEGAVPHYPRCRAGCARRADEGGSGGRESRLHGVRRRRCHDPAVQRERRRAGGLSSARARHPALRGRSAETAHGSDGESPRCWPLMPKRSNVSSAP